MRQLQFEISHFSSGSPRALPSLTPTSHLPLPKPILSVKAPVASPHPHRACSSSPGVPSSLEPVRNVTYLLSAKAAPFDVRKGRGIPPRLICRPFLLLPFSFYFCFFAPWSILAPKLYGGGSLGNSGHAPSSIILSPIRSCCASNKSCPFRSSDE